MHPGWVLLCCSVCQASDGSASLLLSCPCWPVGREAMVTAPPPSVTQQYGLASMAAWFPPPAFPTTISSLTSSQSVSPQSTAALSLGLLHNPLTPAPSHCPFQETSFPVQGMYVCGKDCLILILLRLPQISCFTLSFKCFSSDSDNCPAVGIGPCFSSPTH